ncbi:MAG: hypothetical protein KTR13_09895, partial [Saprospiraceae bacterium]|nr:hypothetical protein [Saprospiraceae bacterium]
SFTLDSVAPGGSTGRLAIRERISEFSVAEIDLPSYQIGNVHPVEVLTGDTSTTATAQVIVSLNNIGPADSISFTHVELDAMGQPLIFDSLASNGHVVIRRSETDNTVIAKGNIESN